MMRLNRNGKLAKFYMWSLFGDNLSLPPDLCSFFWGLVGRALRVMLGAILVLSVVYWIVVGVVFLMHHKAVTGITVGVLLSIAGLIALIVWLRNRAKEIEVVSEVRAVISGKVDAIKNRYCPHIEWQTERRK